MNAEFHAEQNVVGIECPATNDDPTSIGEVWQRFMSEQLADQIPNRLDGNLIAVYCDYEGDHTKPYTFFLGCVVSGNDEVPDGFTSRVVPAGKFVKRTATGEMPSALIEEWMNIWSSDLDRTYVADFEIHNPVEPESIDVFVGVQ